eukprot:1009538_1
MFCLFIKLKPRPNNTEKVNAGPQLLNWMQEYIININLCVLILSFSFFATLLTYLRVLLCINRSILIHGTKYYTSQTQTMHRKNHRMYQFSLQYHSLQRKSAISS